eukprot:gene19146-biopygen10037
MYERLQRLPRDNPARAVALKPEPGGEANPCAPATRPGWRRTARETVEAAGLAGAEREPLPTHAGEDSLLPLRRPPTFQATLCEPVSKRDPVEKRKAVTLRTIAGLPPAEVTVYTDGSVLVPTRSRHGGGAYVLTDGAGKEHRGHTPAGKWCTSFHAEMHALRHALRCMLEDASITVPLGAE